MEMNFAFILKYRDDEQANGTPFSQLWAERPIAHGRHQTQTNAS